MSGEILTCLGHTDWHYFEPCKGDIPQIPHFFLGPYATIGYVNIMVLTEDLWFLAGMTTVLLHKT